MECVDTYDNSDTFPWIILCMRPAIERRRYYVTSSFIGWAYTQNEPCIPRNIALKLIK